MTRLIYLKKEDNRLANPLSPSATTGDAEQVLHLKRLLVTVKKHYESSVQQLQVQLQDEQSQSVTAKNELKKAQQKLADIEKNHEEELQALRHQQNILKEMLKKKEEELHQFQIQSLTKDNRTEENSVYFEQREKELFLLKEQLSKAGEETERLKEELNKTLTKGQNQEQILLQNQKEIDQLHQLLEEQQLQGAELETVVSTTSSHHLRRELEMIKCMLLDGAKETKALELRYVEALHEKTELQQQCKQLQLQLENQSSNLTSFQEQLHHFEDKKKSLELALQAKEAEWIESCQQRQDLQIRMESLNSLAKEKDFIQDKYEQLKDDWKHIHHRLEEAIEARVQNEMHLHQSDAAIANLEGQLQELVSQFQILDQEKGTLEVERDQLKVLLEESEARLKIAQQHLAKKVKEAAVLSEKLDEQQANLALLIQGTEEQKGQIAQLQAGLDLYQRQEKRLQEQLHESLKGNESQIAKWEEKYFRMCDKWQESENRVRELRKFEEKHLQMQSLIANLGNFMGGNLNANSPSHVGQEIEEISPSSFSFEKGMHGDLFNEKLPLDLNEEAYNLFGMRQPMHRDD